MPGCLNATERRWTSANPIKASVLQRMWDVVSFYGTKGRNVPAGTFGQHAAETHVQKTNVEIFRPHFKTNKFSTDGLKKISNLVRKVT